MSTIDREGATLDYEVRGPQGAPCLVLLNSIGTNRHLWDGVVDTLAQRYRVVRYDARGHGLSSTPPGEPTLSDLAADVMALLDAESIATASVVGISIGGQTALTCAVEHADRIDAVVAANTGAKIGTLESWQQRAATVRAEGLGAIVGPVTSGWATAPFIAEHPDEAELYRRWFLANDAEGYAATCHALALGDLRPHLASITAPTLVIAGAGDGPTPPSLTRQIADGIPGATFLEIPGAHLSVRESPDAFADAVLAHLDRHVAH